MKKHLNVGTLMSGAEFNLPLDLVTHTLAIIGIRGWGKTIAATVIAEEMCEAGLPWVAIDPVGVWWGLRCNPDGSLPKQNKPNLLLEVTADSMMVRHSEETLLRSQVAELSQKLGQANAIIANLKKQLEPQYRSLQALFGDLEKVSSNGFHADSGAWDTWKDKLGAGPAKIISLLIERGPCTKVQLKTLAGYSRRSMDNYFSALNSNQLIEKEGDKVKLRSL